MNAGKANLSEAQSSLRAGQAQLREANLALETSEDHLRQQQSAAAELQQSLEAKQVELGHSELVAAGLKVAADQAAKGKGKYFSFLNLDDPIYNLKSYGWNVWSDDYWSFGSYRYYVVIQHPRVRNNRRIIVVRIFEFDEIREVKTPEVDGKQPWQVKLEKMIEQGGPVLVLDYSYFGLLRDKAGPVGGIIYGRSANLKGIKFYAPLDQWSEQLNALFSEETQGIH